MRPADQRENHGKEEVEERWQNTRPPQDKATLNKAVRELKQLFHDEKQQTIQTYLGSLTATEATDNSLWKTTKRLKQPQTPTPKPTTPPPLRTSGGEWAKSDMQKANVLAEHFENVFKPETSDMSETEERAILRALVSPGLPHTPARTFKLT